MEFAFTAEQAMIRESAERFLQDVSTSEAVRTAMATDRGFDPELWERLCQEMYWQALHIPEEYGGLGLGYVELAILFEEMGRRLFCSPFLATVAMGVNALLIAGNEAQKRQWLPQIAQGSLTATLGLLSSQQHRDNRRWDASSVQALARKEGDGYVLSGSWYYVPDGHTVGLLILAAREDGSKGEDGVRLFAVSANNEGVKCGWTPTMDQTRKQAKIEIESLFVSADCCLGGEGTSDWSALEQVLQLASIAIAAEQAGGARQVMELTIDYTRERVQFGRPIASFQAIKHRAADMMLQVECAKSAVYYAACVADEVFKSLSCSEQASSEQASSEQASEVKDQLPEAAALAKAYCSDAFFHCAAESIQLHGGVGFTWEYDPHLYFKRAKSSETFLGDGGLHRERIARQLLDDSGPVKG
ncbi:acyl-CoA dehydrogenase family protein [Endozoicomonas sp. SCSIO W0465]|uniref:acyl-CoA dehydrogenase family protein n=1 Tax=Endozoicomonas sp. SCSIO W0465 TaxID=2918516 RepID=UPI00207595CE|nr:acyl-CoA dehydrogenase family protein [Endozoicomonas sp. SCSIO W0465]USE34657.1 acyl-CoA/acyl-ACP dehydrogenase [Endozoicomonas sp. SCSIO W0465]